MARNAVSEVMRPSLDCQCSGTRSWCPGCLISMAIGMRREHPTSLSVAMLKRRLTGISGREAALLLEISRRVA